MVAGCLSSFISPVLSQGLLGYKGEKVRSESPATVQVSQKYN